MPISNFKSYLQNLPELPGVYQILDIEKNILYVGKARNLKKRVSQYFHSTLANPKTSVLMEQANHIEVIITQTEREALLLENSLIKDKRPRYNVLLKDDKSYPYLFLSKGAFPRLDFYRGSKNREGHYFGPFPSASMIRKTLNLLQKLFKIRQCDDTFFRNRKRPCLQYYIDRCTAPCVDYVTVDAYQQQVKDTVLFLEGKTHLLIQNLEHRMKQEADALNYEKAGFLRDQILDLKELQQKQYVVDQTGEFDIVTLVEQPGLICIGILRIREGRLSDHSEYFPRIPDGLASEEILASFLSQYYLNKVPADLLPKHIVVNLSLKDKAALEEVLSERADKKISITTPRRGKIHEWVKWGLKNTTYALNYQLAKKTGYSYQMESLQVLLGILKPLIRIECFDISHSSGEGTVASNVVFGKEGPIKADYRRFNIENLSKGDDYGAMREVLQRRFSKAIGAPIPDLVIVDGGRGQLNTAIEVFKALGIESITVIGISKGLGRKPGLEKIWRVGYADPLILSSDSVVLHLLQRIRDEAHRFAILGHRKVRDKKRTQSFLEEIPGIGAKRRRLLLSKFGGLQQLKQASVESIASLPGFTHELAKRIYDYLKN